jgi:hypothetical protein
MHRTIQSSIAASLAAVTALGAFEVGPAQAAATKRQEVNSLATLDLSAHRRHYRYRGNNRAALRAFGIIAGTIASIAAAEAARRDCRRYGYCYGYYGYGPYYYPYRRYYYYPY